MANKHLNKLSFVFLIGALLAVVALVAASANVFADTTNPTILSVSPTNNEQEILVNNQVNQVSMVFSEDMNPSSINAATIYMTQRATPESGAYQSRTIAGTVAYSGRTATFTPDERLYPSQQYGNVFTMTVTAGAKDLAGNPLSRNYVWSFTTGGDPFNTGATTSQRDQSQTTAAVTPVPSVPTPEPAVSQTPAQAPAATSTFPWAWVFGGILTALVVWAVIALTSSRDTHHKIVVPADSDPFGDVYKVIELEGIGPEYSSRLQAMGINNTHQLWKANAEQVAKHTGVPVMTVQNWQDMAELSSVRGIGPQHAELLERSGIHSVEQLRKANPDELLSLVRKKQESLKVNIEANRPSHATIQHWIDEAYSGSHKGTA